MSLLILPVRIGVIYLFQRLQNRGTNFPKSHKEQEAKVGFEFKFVSRPNPKLFVH